MQKKDAKVAQVLELKLLEKTDKLLFDFLVKILITGKPNKYEKTIYQGLTKQIRNKLNNNKTKYYINQIKLSNIV